ncbi:hypothetical protein B0H14DRAFT_3624106 [Mycena olivaceomarginata]|nr:hypothetical protein B0H14DRAFT_3624106 [Mycena olivaceomarginata]
MSLLLDLSSLSDDCARTFEDIDTTTESSPGLPEIFRTPKLMPARVQTDTTFDEDGDLFSGDLSKWGPPSFEELLQGPEWFVEEESDNSNSVVATEPADTRTEPESAPAFMSSGGYFTHPSLATHEELHVARVASPQVEEEPLGSDDDYDYAVEIEEERESALKKTEHLDAADVALPADIYDVFSPSPFSAGAPSPPLSSGVSSPESARDFDRLTDDTSESYGRGSELSWYAEFHPKRHATYASDREYFEGEVSEESSVDNLTDDDSEEELDDAFQYEPPTCDTIPLSSPLPRPTMPLPSRYRATQAAGPSIATLSQLDDESKSEFENSDSSDNDSEYGSNPAPSRKRARTSSSKSTAVAAPSVPKRPTAKSRGKAKAPAATSKQTSKSKPTLIVVAGTPRPLFEANAAGVCQCPLFGKGCTRGTEFTSQSGFNRHWTLDHLPRERFECPTGLPQLYNYRNTIHLHTHPLVGLRLRSNAIESSGRGLVNLNRCF